ncbi:MAG: helix-turn-helix domain-containing protein [Acidimicrobiia bacterium]|nr:helix-turn-helix domain-containing protein [Acidimicrobiia bacterium]
MTTLQLQARALGDPTRHQIFRHVADAHRPVDVAELTELLGLNHNAVRQHLAKLVGAELLTEDHAPRSGRGRPRLVYELDAGADSRWGVTGPYERLSVLLAEILRTGESPEQIGRRAAARQRLGVTPDGDPVALIVEAMDRQGFDPVVRDRGRGRAEIVLQHCPFSTAAVADADSVCGIHLGIAEGLAQRTGAVVDELERRDPRRADCRLRLHYETENPR